MKSGGVLYILIFGDDVDIDEQQAVIVCQTVVIFIDEGSLVNERRKSRGILGM